MFYLPAFTVRGESVTQCSPEESIGVHASFALVYGGDRQWSSGDRPRTDLTGRFHPLQACHPGA